MPAMRTCSLCAQQYGTQRTPRSICPTCQAAIRAAGGIYCTQCRRIRPRHHSYGNAWCGRCALQLRPGYTRLPPHVCLMCRGAYTRNRTSRHLCPGCRSDVRAAGNLFCVDCHTQYPNRFGSERDQICATCRAARSARTRAERGRVLVRQTDAERDQIGMALDSGLTMRETAALLGVTRTRVASAIDAGWAKPAVPRGNRRRQHSHWMHSGEICTALGWTRYHWHARRECLPLTPYGQRWDQQTQTTVPAIYVIEGEQLYDWCADPASWMMWQLERCSPDWQRTLAVSRPPGSIDWLLLRIAGPMIGLTRQGLRLYHHHETHPLRMLRRIGALWIWPPDLVAWCRTRDIPVPRELHALAEPKARRSIAR